MDEMCAALGGRAAEEVMFNKISTGALSDLEKVTKQAYAMVTVYGLNPRIGNRSYYDSTGDQSFTKPYSEETSRIIDEEVSILIEGAYDRAKEILRTNKEKLVGLADSLLENEVIFKEDLLRILGKRPFASVEEIAPLAPVKKNALEASSSEVIVEDTPYRLILKAAIRKKGMARKARLIRLSNLPSESA